MERVGQKERDESRIGKSRYNREYEKVMVEHRPDYLRELGKRVRKDKRRIARFKCGNELRRVQFWRKEEERKCKVFGEGE